MKENFEYEKKAVDQLFHKYEAYKPIVSGIYGQDIVESTDHLQTRPVRNMEEYFDNFETNEQLKQEQIEQKFFDKPKNLVEARAQGLIK